MAVRMQKIRVTYQSIPEILKNQEYSGGIAYSGEGEGGGLLPVNPYDPKFLP